MTKKAAASDERLKVKKQDKLLKGIVPVIPTPFSEDGDRILFDAFARVIEQALTEGAHTIMLFGAGGEFYKLEEEERRSLLREALGVCRGRGDVAVTVTEHSTRMARRQALAYQEMGAAAINIMPPSFAMPTGAMIRRHIQDVAKVVEVPLMIQYAPALTGGSLSNEIFADIAEQVKGELYIKIEVTPTGPAITVLLDALGHRYHIVIGNGGECLYEALTRGAVATLSGAAFVKPYRDIIEAFDQGDRKGAWEKYNDFLPYLHFIQRHIEEFVSMEKMVLQARGILPNYVCRRPFIVPDEVTCQLLEQLIAYVQQHFYI